MQKHELTLQLIFFDGEEAFKKWSSTDSTYGSRDLAKKWLNQPFASDGIKTNELTRIDVFVLLDLIGARNPQFVSLKRNTQVTSRIIRKKTRLQVGFLF